MKTAKHRKVGFIFVLCLLVIASLVGCSKDTTSKTAKTGGEESAGEPTNGGLLKVAYQSEPDTLDWSYTGASPTRDIGWHIFETLFALDKNFAIKPMVAKDYKVSKDGLTYTMNLREGVHFHDGSTVTAKDAAASIDRWRKVSSVGKITGAYMDTVKAVNDKTVEIKLKKDYKPFIASMAAPKSALIVIPAKIANEAGEQPLKPEQLIGTGPYKFEKWDKGQKIILSKFKDYSARTETDWGGLTGKKTAHFDKIEFQIVKDSQVMLNGLKTGLYDYAQNIPADLYDVVSSTPNIDPVTYINGYSTMTPDKSEAPFNDLKVRQALNYALDKQAIAEATYGNKKFYSLDGALFDPEQTELYSKEGTNGYLAYDKEKAKKLLKESSYDGRTLKIIYSNNNENYKKISQIVKQQMEEVGFKVELAPYEWATFLDKWKDPKNWDLEVVGWSTRFAPSELGMLSLGTESSGWYKSDRWQDLLDQWGKAETKEQKKDILTKMNQTVYEELPFYKIANETSLDIKSHKLQEYDNWLGQRFWNTWKSK